MAGRFISVEVKGLNELLAKIKRLGSQGENIINKSIAETAIEAVSEMQRNTPVQTNRLRSSEHFELPSTTIYQYADSQGKAYNGKLKVNLPELSVAFGTNVDYATFVNDGVDTVIKPVNKKALAWGKSIGGNKREFVRKSAHVRIKASHFFEAGVEKANEILPERLNVNLEKAINARG